MFKSVVSISACLFLFISVTGQDKEIAAIGKENIEKISATVNLFGKITNATTGEPLPGASVLIADLKLGTMADAGGNYFFSNVPPGHHLIEVSNTGFTSIIEHVDFNINLEKNFALQPAIIENQGVIITGVSNATSLRKAPVPVTVMRRSEMMQTPSSNIIDLLSRKPGVTQVSTGPGISKPVIRGLGYNRVLVINDGVRQEGQQWGDEHGIEIDEYSVGRAEILKGPSSLIYGSDAMAGVINLVTNTPVQEGTYRGNLLANLQSNNDLLGLHANMAGNKKGISWNAYGTLKSAGNYYNRYDGKVMNSSFNEKNTGGYVGINRKWGYSHLIFSTFNQRVGLIEGERDDVTGKFILYGGTPMERIATDADLDEKDPFIPRQQINHYKIASDNNLTLGKNRLKLNVGYQNNLRKEYGNPEDEHETELFFDLKTLTYTAQLILQEKKEWHVTLGANGMYQWNENRGEGAIIPDYNFFDMGGFVFAQRYFKKTTLSGGLRFDNRSINSKEMMDGSAVKFESFHKSFSNISGSAGISYEPSDNITLKINVARGFRSPSLAELASNGAHEGTNRYEYGDRNLQSETSLQFDGGLQADYEHFSIGLAAFYNRVNNYIFYSKLESVFGGDSLVTIGSEDLMAFQFDQYDAQLAGLEMNFDLHPHPLDWLHFENTFSLINGRFTEKIENTGNLPLMPAARWLSEIRGNFKKSGKSFRNLYIKADLDWTFDQNKAFTAFNTETPTPGYALLHAGIGADIINKKEKTVLSIHFGGINITNVAYQNHLSRLKYTDENLVTGRTGVFNAGRNYSLKLNIPLYFGSK